MDSTVIQTKLEQINLLVGEVLQALPSQTASSNGVKVFQEKTCLIPALFEGFQFNEPVHACYAFLCLKADTGRSQNVLVKEYLAESNQPSSKSEVDRLRNAVGYLCRSKNLPKPWLDNVSE